MQMVVLPSSGGFAPVAPMLFTSQLTLSFFMTGCCLGMFPGVCSKWPGRETRNDRRNTRKPFSFPNHPQLCNGLNPQPHAKHFWGNSCELCYGVTLMLHTQTGKNRCARVIVGHLRARSASGGLTLTRFSSAWVCNIRVFQ